MESCDRYLELLSQSLDGPLSESEQRSLQAHLNICPDCRLLAQQLTQIHSELSAWEDLPVPEGFTRGVMDQVRALNDTPKNIVPLWKRPQFKAIGSLAACAVLCLGLWSFGLHSGGAAMDSSVELSHTFESATAAPAETPENAAPAPAGGGAAPIPAPAAYDGDRSADDLVSAEAPPLSTETVLEDQVQSKSSVPSEDDKLVALAEQATGVTPGTLYLAKVLPEGMENYGSWYTADGMMLFLFETLPSQSEQQILINISDQQIGHGQPPLILMINR